MGNTGSRSNTTTDVSSNLLNESDYKSIQEMNTKNIMNTIINNSQNCSPSVLSKQSANISVIGNKCPGPIVIDRGNTNQTDISNFNLACSQNNNSYNDMANDLSESIQNKLAQKFSTQAQAQIAAKAQAASRTGFLSFLAPPSRSNTTTKYKLKSRNIVNTTLENIVNNTIEQNYTTNTLQECLGDIAKQQNANVTVAEDSDCTSITVNGGNTTQELQTNFSQNCVQKNKSISDTFSELQDNFSTVMKLGEKNGDKTVIKATSESKSSAAGIASALKAFFSGFWGIALIIGIVVIVGIIIGYEVLKTPAGQRAIDKASDKFAGPSGVPGAPGAVKGAEGAEVEGAVADAALLGGGGRHNIANAIRQLQRLANMK